jgi:heme/copper-type cytochrome/quinol oxidase subunit 1
VYLVLGLAVGILLPAREFLGLPSSVTALSPVYLHLIVVGWLTQLVFGVAYWMFPRPPKAPPDTGSRAMQIAFVLLNVGLLLRAVAEPYTAYRPGGAGGVGLVLSALVQWLAGLLFVTHMWGRIRDVRRP